MKSKQWLAVIARAIASEQSLFPLNQTWQAIYQEYNIGSIHANKLKLSPSDKQELQVLVKSITGIDLQQVNTTNFASMSREQVLTIAHNEKLAGQAVKQHRLAIKPLPGKPLKLNALHYQLPTDGHWDIALEAINSIGHTSLWIVENYRCFDQLGLIKLHESTALSEPLVIFRGDNVYQERSVLNLVQQLQLPVWVMGDIDPKGLSIAQSFPGFAGLVAPSFADISALLADSAVANRALYSKQYAGCRQALSNSPYPVIQAYWQLLQQHQAGVVQEYWLLGSWCCGLQG